MRRLVFACLASLALYAGLFGFVLDRPLSYGLLSARLDAKLARGASIHVPKLVILAGSNGPYSHRCQLIEKIVGRPCVNGGVAVGIGLDYLFARWKPLLHAGDIVYLPMEEAQYVRPRDATEVGPDASIMFRHDWRTLARLGPRRWLGAFFSFDLRYAVMATIEEALVATHFHDPRPAAEGTMNAWGDHVGHTAALGAKYRAVLAVAHPVHPTAAEVRNGDGTAEIARFLHWARAHGIRTIGGWPTHFADSPIPPATRQAIEHVYQAAGAAFLDVRSGYPRTAFFDSPEHLNETWQLVHSRTVACGLLRLPALAGLWPAKSPRRCRMGIETARIGLPR